MKPVKIYTTAFCGYCHLAKELLHRKGADFEEIDVTGQDEERERLVERSGGQKTVPQIWIGDRHVGGYSDLHALDQAGELDALLGLPVAKPA